MPRRKGIVSPSPPRAHEAAVGLVEAQLRVRETHECAHVPGCRARRAAPHAPHVAAEVGEAALLVVDRGGLDEQRGAGLQQAAQQIEADQHVAEMIEHAAEQNEVQVGRRHVLVHVVERALQSVDAHLPEGLAEEAALGEVSGQLVDGQHLGAARGHQQAVAAGEAADVRHAQARELPRPPTPGVVEAGDREVLHAEEALLAEGAEVDGLRPSRTGRRARARRCALQPEPAALAEGQRGGQAARAPGRADSCP